MSKEKAKKKKCLIVYHFFAHYRLHILRELMRDEEWDFEMVSDSQTAAGIKGIDPNLANVPIQEGGLRWSFVQNCMILGQRFPFLWQNLKSPLHWQSKAFCLLQSNGLKR